MTVERVTEVQVGIAALRIAAASPGGVATFKRLKREIPNLLALSAADRKGSLTRRNEELWEQQIRNLKSHHDAEGNILCEGYARHIPKVGYEITPAGRLHLQHLGY